MSFNGAFDEPPEWDDVYYNGPYGSESTGEVSNYVPQSPIWPASPADSSDQTPNTESRSNSICSSYVPQSPIWPESSVDSDSDEEEPVVNHSNCTIVHTDYDDAPLDPFALTYVSSFRDSRDGSATITMPCARCAFRKFPCTDPVMTMQILMGQAVRNTELYRGYNIQFEYAGAGHLIVDILYDEGRPRGGMSSESFIIRSR